MGTVWRAQDELLERAVALKQVVIPPGLPEPEIDRLHQRYLREARAAARLRHQNVVTVHDIIPETATVWIVMELLDAPDLAEIIRTRGPQTPAAVANTGLQVLAALSEAHAAGIIHRDVKPANVLVTPAGRVVLTDFGVAAVAGDVTLTVTGQLVGSPAYLSPERLTGNAVGPPSDMWSLGCTLYAAVEGRSPFARDDSFETITAITVEAMDPPRRAGRLEPVLYGLLEKDLAGRWDAERTQAALERVAAGLDVELTPSWGSPTADRAAPVSPAPVRPVSPAHHQPRARPASEPRHSSTTGSRRSRHGSASLPISGVAGRPPVYPGKPSGDAHGAGAVATDVGRAWGESSGTGSRRSQLAPLVSNPPARPRRRRRVKLLLIALAIVVGFAAGVALVLRDPGPPASSGTPAPTGVVQPGRQGEVFTHPSLGYRLAVPGWRRSCPDSRTCQFTDLTGPAANQMNLFVEVHPAGGENSLALSNDYDAKLAADPAKYPRYRSIEIKAQTVGRYLGTVQEFEYTNARTGHRHVLIFRTVSDDVCYQISLNGPANRFAENRPVWAAATDSFVLPGD
jgi:serine/threonine protein kinase